MPLKPKKLPSSAEIFEVGPRDGLQAEAQILSLEQKVGLIEKLIASGLKDIEVGSFIKPDLIPQMNGSEKVVEILTKRYPKAGRKSRFWAFVPNQVGLERAAAAQIDGASFFIAASDTFCHKNVNRSLEELLKELPSMLKVASKMKVRTRVYLSTLVYCPYEGVIKPQKVLKVVDAILKAGASEVALSDTTGHADPLSLRSVLEPVLKKHSPKKFALHLHDTRGLALTNVLVGLEHGIRRFDSSIAGTGGCPFAPGASGNLATEDLAHMLIKMKLLKSVDLSKLVDAGVYMEKVFMKRMPSKALNAFTASTSKIVGDLA